jgi:hypothetical protein
VVPRVSVVRGDPPSQVWTEEENTVVLSRNCGVKGGDSDKEAPILLWICEDEKHNSPELVSFELKMGLVGTSRPSSSITHSILQHAVELRPDHKVISPI